MCKGCINCIKRCPTEAIRVRNGKAVIRNEFCIDCGECIRICPHHAKLAVYDTLDIIKQYAYTVALPAPSLYGQFNHLEDVNIVLTALKRLGFDDVYEVSAGAELVSELTRVYIEEHTENWPWISTACPSIVRLIRVRFPNLIEHLLPMKPPVEIAAELARKRAMGLLAEQIGIVFISPCPSKVTWTKTPLGIEKSNIDAVCAIKDIYKALLSLMKQVAQEPEELSISGKIGISWGTIEGEASGLLTERYLAADGMENVIRVLEDLEDQKITDLKFIELNACHGGCVGGVLTVENPYAARAKLKQLRKYMPVAKSHMETEWNDFAKKAFWTKEVEYEPVFKLGANMRESISRMAQLEALCKKFPGLDCGSCGAPTCKALAEDIVKGKAKKEDCIIVLKALYEQMIFGD